MIWYVVIGIVGFTLFRFFKDYSKDNQDLQGQILSEKFGTLVNLINDAAFGGTGEVINIDKREFQLYKDRGNQIIQFVYGTGNLTVIWRYKYFQKEVVHEKTFYDVRDLRPSDQTLLAEGLIEEMQQVVAKHQANISGL